MPGSSLLLEEGYRSLGLDVALEIYARKSEAGKRGVDSVVGKQRKCWRGSGRLQGR
jgi:hypothetical protein